MRSIMKTKYIPIFIALSLLVTGCQEKSSVKEQSKVAVKVTLLRQGSDPLHAIGYSGTLDANTAVNLSFQVSGTILNIPVEMGDYVKKGQLIAQIDPTTYQNQYNAAKAQAELARENYQRILEVYKKGSIAEIKMLEAKYNYEQANSQAKAAYQNLEHTRIIAPFSGFVGSKNLSSGDLANPGQIVLQLLDITTVKASVTIPNDEINKYKKGDSAIITVDSFKIEKFEGFVDEVSVISNPGNPAYALKVNIPNPDRQLKPGMVCNVYLANASTAKPILIVPVQSIQIDEKGNHFAYIADDSGTATRKEVTTGTLYKNGIEVSSGLQNGDKLIISGYHKLTDGTPISIVE